MLNELEIHAFTENTSTGGMQLPRGSAVETIYFGGGTPSILPPAEIESLLNKIRSIYCIKPGAELTLEANPDDIAEAKLSAWKSIGINRLSIGVQSFIEQDLAWTHRAHNAQQAIACIQMALDAGFQNLSVDLIFGIPNLPDELWRQNIHTLVSLKIPHVAAYALTVEPKTALDKMIRLKKKEDINNEQQARQFEILMDLMGCAGYEHYEISNFAQPGFRSRHNSSYWQQKPYLGIGPSAHSFDGIHRFWNISNNIGYMNAVASGNSFFEMETLSITQKLNEYIMTSLRTIEGLDLRYLRSSFSNLDSMAVQQKARRLPAGWLIESEDNLRLSDAGKLFADKISADLFF